MIPFSCPCCGQALELGDEVAGGVAACIGCGERIRVPKIHEVNMIAQFAKRPASSAPRKEIPSRRRISPLFLSLVITGSALILWLLAWGAGLRARNGSAPDLQSPPIATADRSRGAGIRLTTGDDEVSAASSEAAEKLLLDVLADGNKEDLRNLPNLHLTGDLIRLPPRTWIRTVGDPFVYRNITILRLEVLDGPHRGKLVFLPKMVVTGKN